MLTLAEYQVEARKTNANPGKGIQPLMYSALGLSGEAGEVANKVKKIWRDNRGILTSEVRDEIAGELGDTLWYIANTCTEIGLTLEEVAEGNLTKLADRYRRGVIKGSGDKR